MVVSVVVVPSVSVRSVSFRLRFVVVVVLSTSVLILVLSVSVWSVVNLCVSGVVVVVLPASVSLSGCVVTVVVGLPTSLRLVF